MFESYARHEPETPLPSKVQSVRYPWPSWTRDIEKRLTYHTEYAEPSMKTAFASRHKYKYTRNYATRHHWNRPNRHSIELVHVNAPGHAVHRITISIECARKAAMTYR